MTKATAAAKAANDATGLLKQPRHPKDMRKEYSQSFLRGTEANPKP